MSIVRLTYLFVSVLVSVPNMSISGVVETPSEFHPVSVSFDQVRNFTPSLQSYFFPLAFFSSENSNLEALLFTFKMAVKV